MATSAREIICMHIGGAGCRLGAAFWDSLCLEHGIAPDGKGPARQERRPFETFFSYNGGKYVPRALFIDTDPSAIAAIRSGAARDRFLPDQFIAMKESVAGVYARGYENVGREAAEIALEAIQREVQRCQNFGGFLLFHSVAGGTGSGLASRILENISTEFYDKRVMGLSVFPSAENEPRPTAPYNAVLGAQILRQHSALSVILDNTSLYGVCRNALGIPEPSYADLNRVGAKIASAFTAPMRVDGGKFLADPARIIDELVQYPSMVFAVPDYAAISASLKPTAGRPAPAVKSPEFVTTASKIIPQVFERIESRFHLLFAKQAFVHHYMGSASLEEGSMEHARDDFASLRTDYLEFTDNASGISR